MPVSVNIRKDNIAANSKTENLLANTDLAFAPSDGVVQIFGVASASGINIEVGVGNDKAISDREILFYGTSIDKSAHLISEFQVAGGSPLSLFLRETAGVATTDVILIVEHTSFDELA